MSLPPDRHYDSYVDFYQAEYGSFITRVTPLPFATLMTASQTAGDWSDLPTPDLVFGRIADGQRTFSADIGAGRFGGKLESNRTLVFAPQTQTSIQVAGRHSLQMVGLPYARLKSVVGDDLRLPEDGDFGALHTRWLANPLFGQKIGAMFDVADPADPVASLYFESTLLSLVAMLVMEARKPASSPLHRGGLAPWQVRRCCEYLTEHACENVGLEKLASLVGLSPFHFARAFRQSTGLPPHRYQLNIRIARAKALLEATDAPVTEIALTVGYESPQALARQFRQVVGVSRSDYRRGRQS